MATAGMESISEAVMDKVSAEAQTIVEDAENRAKEEIERAEAQRARQLEERKRKLIEEAQVEAARIMAKASIRARQDILAAKSGVIDEIVSRVKQEVLGAANTKTSLSNLIKEAADPLGGEKLRLYVAKADLDTVRSIQSGSGGLGERIVEVKEAPISGGVIAENEAGTIRIDNSYETRLEILLPRILPDVGKELFKVR